MNPLYNKYHLLTLIFFICVKNIVSRPKSLEVWFLSPPATVAAMKFKRVMLSLNSSREVVGDKDYTEEILASPSDQDMITCDPDYHFDLFCGKAKKDQTTSTLIDGPVDYSLFIDVSGSMKEVDPTISNTCQRQYFVQTLYEQQKAKNKNVLIKIFDVPIRPLAEGNWSALCGNDGLNDDRILMDAIKKDESNHLIVVTDTTEMGHGFYNFLETMGATILGEFPNRPFRAIDMRNQLSRLP